MQTAWEEAVHSTDKTVVPETVQENDPNSLLNFYRKWIAYRNSSKALTFGTLEQSPINNIGVVSMIRQKDDEKVLAIQNLTSNEITIEMKLIPSFTKIDFSTGMSKIDGDKLILSGNTSVILK